MALSNCKSCFHTHQLTLLTSFHQLRNQFGHAMETNLLALPTGGNPQRGGEMRFSRAGMPD
jgi:hypothetical protein